MSGTFITTTQTTRQVSTTDIVGVSSIAFIRPIEINITVTDTKPRTRVYPFFDGIAIDRWTRPVGGNNGDVLITDSAGRLNAVFSVPPVTFNTGKRTLRIQDSPIFNPSLDVAGSLVGSASAEFNSQGIKRTLQETLTTITEVTITRNELENPPPPSDPLAQTIFTYGVTGGCFVTKVDVWFQSKDSAIPVVLELREVENGYPARKLVSNDARVSLDPSQVNISQNASVATTFKFQRPIYLDEGKDYCFVLLANSNNYHVWTSKLGEKSIETGKTVFEQPFIGTLFKSENNVTWTAEQTEDIKFRVWKAKFNTSVQATIDYTAPADKLLVYGTQFSVTSGSPVVTVDFNHQHALNVDSKIILESFPGMNYRGIPASALTGEFSVVSVIDPYKITFNAGVAATSTGNLGSAGSVLSVEIDNAGTGYTTSPTLTFSPPTSGVTATGEAVISNGRIVAVTITNPGSGYLSSPTVTVSGGGGSGAVLVAIVEAIFVVETNRMVHLVNPIIQNAVYPDTTLSSNIRTTREGYILSQARSVTLNDVTDLRETSWAASTSNETAKMFGARSTELHLTLSSNNENTSPVINVAEQTRLATFAYIINNQDGDTITATSATGTVSAIVVTAGGSGYSSAPTVQIIGNGTGATATATVSGGIVTAVTVTNPGTGYTEIPTISFTGGGGSGAAAQALLTAYNTELLARGGKALSKYITKPITLATVSKGIRLFASAYSESASSFEFYIRTSLSGSGVTHTDQNWRRLNCDVERNLSTRPGEFKDYTFYLDNIAPFDVYDIKLVMRTSNKAIVPTIQNYRVIILAT